MRPLGSLLIAILAGIVTFTLVFPAVIVLALVALGLGVVAAIMLLGMVLSFIGWLITHDPAALSATLKCAAWGSAASLPSFLAGYYGMSLLDRRRQAITPRLDEPFEEPLVRTRRHLTESAR
jgi:hypothetical protein